MKEDHMVADITRKTYILPGKEGAKSEVRCLFRSYPFSGTLALDIMCRNMKSEEQEFSVLYDTVTIEDQESRTLPDNMQFLTERKEKKWGNWLRRNGIACPLAIADVRDDGSFMSAYQFNVPDDILRRVANNRRYGCRHELKAALQDIPETVCGQDTKEFLTGCLGRIKETRTAEDILLEHKRIYEAGLQHPLLDCSRTGMFTAMNIRDLDADRIMISLPDKETESLSHRMAWSSREIIERSLDIYRNRVRHSIEDLIQGIEDHGIDRRRIEDFIQDNDSSINWIDLGEKPLEIMEPIEITYERYGIARKSMMMLVSTSGNIIVPVLLESWTNGRYGLVKKFNVNVDRAKRSIEIIVTEDHED